MATVVVAGRVAHLVQQPGAVVLDLQVLVVTPRVLLLGRLVPMVAAPGVPQCRPRKTV